MSKAARRGEVFRYESFSGDADSGLLTCRYSLDGREFEERVTLPPGPRWELPAARAAARLVFLLAGVSYYKTAAPPVIDLGPVPLTGHELDFLREFYLQGLGEFAYRNNLDLSDLRIGPGEESRWAAGLPDPGDANSTTGRYGPAAPRGAASAASERLARDLGRDPGKESRAGVRSGAEGPGRGADGADRSGVGSGGPEGGGASPGNKARRALVPFGGGIDSIVTVEKVRALADSALFVVSRPGDRFAAIEAPAAVAGLPVVRAGREIDSQLLRSADLGFFNGHVPVTGILSAIAILAAVLDGRDAVVMSNEWSASVPTLEHNGQPVNHQYSKSASFEARFRAVLAASDAGLPDYFSALRDRTELWVGAEFAALERYHGAFRSCNRAFTIDPARRLGHWCGECDKCCFIDLILAPFLPAAALREVFAVAGEPLGRPELAGKFRTLLGAGTKPFECVGEVSECRAAAALAARRADRADCALLRELAAEVAGRPDLPSEDETAAMLRPVGQNFIPAAYSFGGSGEVAPPGRQGGGSGDRSPGRQGGGSGGRPPGQHSEGRR